MAGEGEVRRTTEFGSTKDDLALAANSASRGMVVAGRTAGTIRLDVGHQGGFDAIVSYHRNLSEITALEQFGSDGNDEALDAKVTDQQVYSSGYTEGEMFGTHNGGEDWWVARFDIVEDEELEQEVLSEVWKIQGGTSGNERLVRVAPTEFGKVFAIIEENVGGTIYMTIAPLSVVDGISLYAACRETLDGC